MPKQTTGLGRHQRV